MAKESTNVVEDLLFAVEALKQSSDQEVAINHMVTQLENLKTLLPFVVTAGADTAQIRGLVIELANELDIEVVLPEPVAPQTKSNSTTITYDQWKEFMNNNCIGEEKKKTKSNICNLIGTVDNPCKISPRDMKDWVRLTKVNDEPMCLSKGDGAGKAYWFIKKVK
ncbi:MAG: hypothetical protein ACO3NJ_06645 [Candidatus Poseidoniaceae archaeon]